MNSRIVRSDCSLPAGRLWKAGLVDESLWRQMEQMRLKMVTVPPKQAECPPGCSSAQLKTLQVLTGINVTSILSEMTPKNHEFGHVHLERNTKGEERLLKSLNEKKCIHLYTCFPQVTSYQFINTYIHIFCTYVTCPDVNKHLFNTTTIQYITTLTGINNRCTLHRVTGTPYVALFDAFTHLSGYPVDRKGHWDVGF